MNVSIFVFVAHINYPGLWVISSNVERVPEVASRQWLHRIKSVGLFCLFDKLRTSIQRCFKGRARSLVYLLKKIKGFLVIWVRVRIWQPLTGNESQLLLWDSLSWSPVLLCEPLTCRLHVRSVCHCGLFFLLEVNIFLERQKSIVISGTWSHVARLRTLAMPLTRHSPPLRLVAGYSVRLRPHLQDGDHDETYRVVLMLQWINTLEAHKQCLARSKHRVY